MVLIESQKGTQINRHGGLRPGAGRKPDNLTRQTVSATLIVLSRPALKNLAKILADTESPYHWDATRWVLEKIDGKPVQRVESPTPQQNNLIFAVGDLRQLIALLETRLALPQPLEDDDAASG